MNDLLGHFEHSEQAEGPETREAKGPCPRLKVDPEHFEDGAGDDNAVEPVKCGREVDERAQGVQPDPHLEHKGSQEEKLSVN